MAAQITRSEFQSSAFGLRTSGSELRKVRHFELRFEIDFTVKLQQIASDHFSDEIQKVPSLEGVAFSFHKQYCSLALKALNAEKPALDFY